MALERFKHFKRLRHPSQLSARDLVAVILPALLVIGGVLWFAQKFVQPAPPRTLTISSGYDGGAYYAVAMRYREILARDGVDLVVKPSAGAVENLERLRDPESGVDVALVQSGMLGDDAPDGLVSLGSLFYEPLWVFYRSDTRADRLTDLRGMRIAIGNEGSGARRLAIQLLSANGISAQNSTLLSIGGDAANKAFINGRADAIFVVGAPEAAVVKSMFTAPGARLMSFAQAEAYARLYPALTRVVVPRGTLSLERDLPRDNIQLVAPTATLVAREDLHPALVSLLLGAATEVHGGPGLLQKAGEFPSGRAQDFPLSDTAQRYYKSGPPFLQRYLPFWVAVLVDRLIILIIPLIAIAIPLMRIMPGLYAWRIRSRIFKLYGELRMLDDEVREQYDPDRHDEYRKRLADIDELANRRRIPLAYAGELYNLREHIQLVRGELRRRRANAPHS
jgi:TRAP transporter TAXI family solute receptor